MRQALVLSGGGLFGAWQAGAWSALADQWKPDLIVGASAGSLNGYAIASGATPEELRWMWLKPEFSRFRDLHANIRRLMDHYSPKIPLAVTATDAFRMKPAVFRDSEITWKHLAASCALPILLPQVWIGGRLYSDGGLLNPLPVWAAVELGATQIVAVHALPEIPSRWMAPLVRGFRRVAGHNPPVPPGVEVVTICPGRRLGSMRDTARWKRDNIERWLAQGAEDAKKHFHSVLS
jgi:NTE family protein